MSDGIFLEFDFGQVSIFDSYMVVVMDEDTTVQRNYMPYLQEISDTYFKNKSFVYIANRINNYAVDPLIYKSVSQIENLIAFAVVSTSENAKNQIKIEAQFYDKELKHFNELNQAINWASNYVKLERSKSKYDILSDDTPVNLELDFCKVAIYKSYVIVNINEGFTTQPNQIDIFKNLVNAYYGTNPFVYISHRVNSYSVNPAVYNETSKVENLRGYAIVDEKSTMYNSAQVEKLFYNKAFESFDNLEEAKKWAIRLLNEGFTPNLC
ncbi:hypothetical protein ABN763_00765 [Spongiivirga sp. MCCC 1A20706]|uniref:hypothetical protein n=1 Tax=Spongiivirga sp. MCCC 1A20706 TaxID=3160963 RepID=UPI003977D7CB